MMSDCCDYNIFALHTKKKRHLYEKLDQGGDDDDDDEVPATPKSLTWHRSWRVVGLPVLVTLVVVVLLLGMIGRWIQQVWRENVYLAAHSVHHEQIPTFLSIRRPHDGTFVYALDNPLYEQLQQATLSHRDTKLQKSSSSTITVRVSSTQLHPGQDLTLQWSSVCPKKGISLWKTDWLTGQPDENIWVLYCGKGNYSQEELWQYANAYEVATVSQVQASSSCEETVALDDDDNCWHISNFPTSHRQETCQFVLYNTEWEMLVASPRINTLEAVTSPTNLHLALTHDPTQMTIQFASGKGTPIVAYADVSDASKWIDGHVPGTTTTYEAADMCMAPANETGPGKFQSPGLLHTVLLTNLQPNTQYVYKAGAQHGQGVTWSETATFTTAPWQNDTSIYPFTYLVYADQGCPLNGWFQGAAWTAAVVAKEIPSIRMVHHFGDLSYAQGAAHQWDAWMTMIEPIAKHVPYHIGIGNHEYDYTANGDGKDPTGNDMGYHPVWGNFHDDSGGECGVPASKRFQMPASDGGVFWYAHNFANLHTIVLSSEHDLSPGSVQYEWLAHDLTKVDRQVTPWVVVEIHRPLYEGEALWDQNDVGIALRMEVEHMLRDYQVDLVLAGHYHAYHRTCDGLYRNQCYKGGPMHITIGTAGAHLDEADLFDNTWSEIYIKQTYGYGRITIYNATDLDFEFIRGAAADDDPDAGKVLDSVRIHRERS
uniref:Purple acid phosphatase n=1 Tax=Amphora coffeiformis TaxID=265554 RepID=A0A7S3L3I9_9STRA